MSHDVLCLRPQADFQRAGVAPPAALNVAYRQPDDPQLAAHIRAAGALVIPAVGPRLAGALFRDTAVKLVQVTGAGVDRLDEAAMKSLGIAVCNVPGNPAVAEYCVAVALVLLRRLAWADAEIRAGNYVPFRGRLVMDGLPGLDGLTVGLIGLGVIGLSVAEAFHRHGCDIVYHDPAPRDAAAAAQLGARALPLDELLKSADVVSLHVPLVPQTRNLLGPRQFALMKHGAVLIQASRGGVVNEQALITNLNSGRLSGAAVDVYSTEPPEPDHPLFGLEGEAARRVLFTPHIAGVTRQSTAVLLREAWANVERVLVRGEPPRNRIY
jgi:phosphoglycerate dehydrogenase-like enzyme